MSQTGRKSANPQTAKPEKAETRKRNAGKRSIKLNEILSGGVSKDGTPAIDAPKFESVKQASDRLLRQVIYSGSFGFAWLVAIPDSEIYRRRSSIRNTSKATVTVDN